MAYDYEVNFLGGGIHHKFNNRQEVIFVFGAGASYADGAPLQDEILPIILSGELKDIAVSDIGKTVCEFIADNFSWDEQAGIYPTLESVFGFLDYFINQDEHLSARYPNMEIHALKERLIKLIHFVISEKSNRRAMVYRSFWEALLNHNRSVSVLTLNYDTLLEEAFKTVYPEDAGIDYCIPLMNDDLNNEMANQRLEFRAVEQYEIPVTVKIMKGHGSLNWKYCNCCNQVLLTSWNTKINLYSGGFEQECGNDAGGAKKYCCPLDGSEFETLIIPPSHIKRISHPVISQILNESLREIRQCKKVIFVGYSFPDADVHFKALFKKGLINGQEIFVVNRTIGNELVMNYSSLSGKVRFIECSFADLIEDNFMGIWG